MTLTIPGIVAAAGALIYALVPGKIGRLGEIAFGAGLLALLLSVRH